MCLQMYGLDHAHFLSAPELARQAALKRTKVKLDLLTNIDNLIKRHQRWNISCYSPISNIIHQYLLTKSY